jgi:RNA polymerase sigma-70 factor (ECF subfamily)
VLESSPEWILRRKLLQYEVQQAIDALPEGYREVIVLRELEDLSYDEIAAVIEVPRGTVMSRLARARERLRKVLHGFAGAPMVNRR